MSTTLTNGLKLPDKGSVDWYADMQSNYAILDGAVGTVAEHTSQIAGKAPLVHTHTKADITDFPAYGNAAGTICEGNDSRLSDARTPVAHTHGKADITDLFNSANTWTEHNTYARYIFMKNTIIEIGNAPSSNTSKEISFTDKNNATLSRLVGKAEASGNSYIFLHATNKYTNGALDPNGSARHSYFYVGLDATGKAYNKHAADTFPDANNTYDLGSSSYQWNNLYAKNYYYNGTAWGLDKANVWTVENTFTAANLFRKREFTLGDNSSQIVRMEYKDTNNSRWGILSFIQDTNNTVHCDIGVHALKTDGQTVLNRSVTLLVKPDNSSEFKPINNKAIDLGTSTNKWKTLNGVNPGALSLPDSSKSATIDTTGYADSNNFYWTPPSDGWLFVNINNCSLASIKTQIGEYYINQPSGWYRNTIPVAKNKKVILLFACPSLDIPILIFYPCLGNV